MDQAIFKTGLSVEAVSLYLLCCSLVDVDTTVSSRNIRKFWTGTPEHLAQAFKDLEGRNILKKILSDQDKTEIFRIMEPKDWRS